jgi:glyoxylase-like metal-dependent hydrolase (beta-lactamase superfamily II)
VVFTHAHFDHVGWATEEGEGAALRPAFPNARYMLAEPEWRFWTGAETAHIAHHRAAFARSILPLEAAGRLTLVEPGAALGDGLSYLPLPGHTPGQQGVLIESKGERGLIAGDTFHTPVQVSEPDWSHRADWDRDEARRTRHAGLARAAAEGLLLACGHFPEGRDIGRVVRDGKGLRWQPVGMLV